MVDWADKMATELYGSLPASDALKDEAITVLAKALRQAHAKGWAEGWAEPEE